MNDRIFVPPTQPTQIRPVEKINRGQNAAKKVTGPSFKDVLAGEVSNGVKFSAHAQARLAARNISLSENQLDRINSGVEKAASKGARESLVLIDNLALVVSIKNNTVITAVDDKNLKENVFTNIDSAVIM
jgi:flagellar operon protein